MENFTTLQAEVLVRLVDAGELGRSRTHADGCVTNRTAGWLLKHGYAKTSAENTLLPTREAKLAAKRIRKEMAAA